MDYDEFFNLSLGNVNRQALFLCPTSKTSDNPSTYYDSVLCPVPWRNTTTRIRRVSGAEVWKFRCRHTGKSARDVIRTQLCDFYNHRKVLEVYYQRPLEANMDRTVVYIVMSRWINIYNVHE